MTISILNILLIILVFALPELSINAEKKNREESASSKIMSISDIWLDANRMNGVFRNNGIWYHDATIQDWGLEWPKGSGLSPVFAAGQLIASKVNGEIRVAGIQHASSEFQPGEIFSPFVPSNPTDSTYKWYSLLPDSGGNWTNWPFMQGASYNDLNGNWQYDPGEPPLLLGDNTIFSIWNDLANHSTFGTNQLSVEVKQTVFAFDKINELGDVQFIKWQLVNKSGMDWDSTYFAIWFDPDIGNYTDDLAGCDTMLNLGFAYNATNYDQNYGTAPPAAGVYLLQGPIIDNPDSTIILPNGRILTGKEMIGMSCFMTHFNNSSAQGTPYNGYDVWNYLRAFWLDSTQLTFGGDGTDPNNPPTNFQYTGDPETQTGWLAQQADDYRFLMTIGPFFLPSWIDTSGNGIPDFGEPGVQDIILVTLVARGTDNLNSVTKLKTITDLAQQAYQSNFNLTSISNKGQQPVKFQLKQNYPNPFNPSTTIEFSIPKTEFVTLRIYNILGQEVATLVSDKMNAGNYKYNWNAAAFASGIYYYKIESGKEFIQTKKLLLIK